MSRSLELDTSKTGLRAFLKDYEEEAMRALWSNPVGLNSREVWEKVNEELGAEGISRASVINFLEYMRERGVLGGIDRTGKGGHHWVYVPSLNEADFKQYLARTLIDNLLRDFPAETKAALGKYSKKD